MAEIIGGLVVLLLAVYGCAQGVRWITLKLFSPGGHWHSIWLIPLRGHREDVEYVIRTASVCRRWNGAAWGDVCIVDDGADTETYQLAQRLCAEVSGVRLIKAAEIRDVFSACGQK